MNDIVASRFTRRIKRKNGSVIILSETNIGLKKSSFDSCGFKLNGAGAVISVLPDANGDGISDADFIVPGVCGDAWRGLIGEF